MQNPIQRPPTPIERVVAMLFPPHCLVCHGDVDWNDGVCTHCAVFVSTPTSLCPRCDRQMPWPQLCGRCRSMPPNFESVIAAFRYQPPVIEKIHRIKFGAELNLIESAGVALAREVARRGVRPDVIAPIPLHSTRLKDRGFDQALELARVVSRRLVIPMARHTLVRVRETAHQSSLNADHRRANVARAFHCRSLIKGQHVALVDDVLTTGATANAAAGTLRRAGAVRTDIWVLARA